MNIFRQGDVKIKLIKKADISQLKEKPDLVLAEGEMTGHAHRIVSGQVKLYWNQEVGGSMILDVETPAELFHEEHESIKLPPGKYEISKQVEWDWFSKMSRTVAD